MGLGEYLAQTGQPYTLTSQAHFVTESQWSGLNNEQQNIEGCVTKDGVALRGVGAKTPTSRRLREIFY